MPESSDKPVVLLVEDEEEAHALLVHVLSEEYRILGARDGNEALRILEEQHADLVISDVVMPRLDGIALLRALRGNARTQAIPVLLVSGRASDAMRIEGFEGGADGYLQKPYTGRELAARVRALLQISQIRTAAARREAREQAERDVLVERADLLESITDGFYALDQDWRFTYLNRRALDYFRASRDRILGKDIWEWIPQARGTIFEERLGRVMRERYSVTFEAFSSYSSRWVELHAYPTQGGIAVHFRDISRRKQQEAALRDAEERYRAFVANSSEGIWRYELEEPLDVTLAIDAQLRHLYRHAYLAEANDAMARMYGYERADEIVGARLEAMLPEQDEASAAYLRLVIQSAYRISDVESIERDKGGGVRYFANSMVPVVADGKLLRVWGSQRDVTERKLSEAILRDSEERLRRTVNVSTVGVLFFRLDGRIIDANEAFQRMSGYSRVELLANEHWESLTVEVFHRATRDTARELAERGTAPPYEKQMRRKDGSLWWGLFAPTRLSGEGYDAECVEFIIDITEQRLAQQALEDADRRKDEFLATLAHELRNPLAPLKNGLQIARLTSAYDSPLQRTFDMMNRQLNHLVRLVDDLMDVARISSGKVVLRKERIVLREVVAQAIEGARALIDSKEHDLRVDASEEDLVVEGDFDRLAQVFSNLLSNAAKYSHMRGSIQVRISRQDTYAVVQVIDDGIGIPQEELKHVFDLFTQVREHQGHAGGGLGIGLSLVKNLVTHHGGSVSVDSAGVGRGSTFTVRLPLVESDIARARAPVSDSLQLPSESRRRILVADDNVDAADSLAALLALSGHDVHVAHGGAEALEKAGEVRPHLVFLDLGMPELDGVETARRLRQLPEGADMVIVALTGWGQAADRERTRAAGFDAHLVKPIDADAVIRALALCGSQARSRS